MPAFGRFDFLSNDHDSVRSIKYCKQDAMRHRNLRLGCEPVFARKIRREIHKCTRRHVSMNERGDAIRAI